MKFQQSVRFNNLPLEVSMVVLNNITIVVLCVYKLCTGFDADVPASFQRTIFRDEIFTPDTSLVE